MKHFQFFEASFLLGFGRDHHSTHLGKIKTMQIYAKFEELIYSFCFVQHFEEEVVEDFVGWVFLQLCVQVAVIFYAWTMLGMLENVSQNMMKKT